MSTEALSVIFKTCNAITLVVAKVDTHLHSHRVLEVAWTSKSTTGRRLLVTAFIAERSDGSRRTWLRVLGWSSTIE